MSGSDDIEDIKEQKRRELIERAKQQQQQGDASRSGGDGTDPDTEAILKQWLTDDARKRLNTVQMAHPERGQAIERQLVGLARQGRLQERIDDEKMKQILQQADDSDSKSFDIKRR